jgi:hypothetical protein
MKKIFIFLLAFFFSIFSSNATYTTGSSNWYNQPIMDGSISFKAELKDWKVYTSWSKYNKNEWFKYYKVIKSQTVSNPVYPDNGYIKYSKDINFLSYVDEKIKEWVNYYRVCAITTEQNRYCSNVVKIVNNNENEIYKIWAKRVDCYGSYPQKCLIVNWKYFYDYIKGFDYKEWYEYKIEVKKEKTCNLSIVWDCPQDASIYKYSLVKIISKQKEGEVKVCTMEYAPVCWQPPMSKCPHGVVCRIAKPQPKTYSNKCMLEWAWAEYLYKWACKKDIKPVIPYKLRVKADLLVRKLGVKVDKMRIKNESKIKIINSVIIKLEDLKLKKEKLWDLIDYIVAKLKVKVDNLWEDFSDIENIFNTIK